MIKWLDLEAKERFYEKLYGKAVNDEEFWIYW